MLRHLSERDCDERGDRATVRPARLFVAMQSASSKIKTRGRWFLLAAYVCTLLACRGGSKEEGEAQTPVARDGLSPGAQLGKLLFFDKSLSASGRMEIGRAHV